MTARQSASSIWLPYTVVRTINVFMIVWLADWLTDKLTTKWMFRGRRLLKCVSKLNEAIGGIATTTATGKGTGTGTDVGQALIGVGRFVNCKAVNWLTWLWVGFWFWLWLGYLQIYIEASVPQSAQGGGRLGGTAWGCVRNPAITDNKRCDVAVESTAWGT